MWLVASGPPLLALSWWLTPNWKHLDGSLYNLALRLIYPGSLVVLFLIGFSAFYYPVKLSPRIRLPAWQIILLWCIETLTLWHWLVVMAVLFCWLTFWGDLYAPPMDVIYASTGFVAALVSSLTCVRCTRDGATATYLVTIISLTCILIVLAFPLWLERLLR